jgi:hypothetical protein
MYQSASVPMVPTPLEGRKAPVFICSEIYCNWWWKYLHKDKITSVQLPTYEHLETLNHFITASDCKKEYVIKNQLKNNFIS